MPTQVLKISKKPNEKKLSVFGFECRSKLISSFWKKDSFSFLHFEPRRNTHCAGSKRTKMRRWRFLKFVFYGEQHAQNSLVLKR